MARMHDKSAHDNRQPKITQSERSSRTRLLVCEATLDALVELGGDRVSTSIVAKRAKISRGALTHQFQTRNSMFVAAYRHLIESWRNSYPFNTGPNYVLLTIDQLVDALWELIYAPRRYSAAIELMLQAAKDHELGRELREILDEWVNYRDAAAMRLLGVDPDDKEAVSMFQITLAALRGLALFNNLS